MPRARSSSLRDKIAFNAPRILNEWVLLAFSSLSQTFSPSSSAGFQRGRRQTGRKALAAHG